MSAEICSMETKYFGDRFLSVKITASCLWIWFADIRLWIQQTKHLQCIPIPISNTLACVIILPAWNFGLSIFARSMHEDAFLQ